MALVFKKEVGDAISFLVLPSTTPLQMVARKGPASPKKHPLKFDEKLNGSTDILLKKLKALHLELAEMDQDLVDTKTLDDARKGLISKPILLHKDRGVKAYTACCLADILRLYAPDAPYTQTELRDIFQFFFRQLSTGLQSNESTYYNEYFHLLESLSTVKSVVLVCDLPHADELMTEIFRAFFALVKRDLARKIEIFMADILAALIDECQSLPPDVLDAIMSQFTDKNAKPDQPAFRMVTSVCNATADKLQRHVCQYFTDIIVADPENDEFEEVKNAHNLVIVISRSCPALLHSVIPQLEEELRVEETQLRLLSTQVLGEIFSNKGGLDFVRKYPSTWNMWQQRKNDKVPQIRVKVVEACVGLLVNLPEQRDAVEAILATKLLDPDEKVRGAVCKAYSQMGYEMVLHFVELEKLKDLARRGLDKKHHVRIEALTSIARLFSLAYPEIEKGDLAAIEHFAWIPQEILHISSANPEVKLVAEQVLGEYILPLPSTSGPSTSKSVDVDEEAWTDRLLNVMQFLDEKAINILLGLSGIKSPRPSLIDKFIQSCIDNNGGVIDDNDEVIKRRLAEITRRVASSFPDPHKAMDDLNAFATLNEGRLYKLFKACTDGQADLKSLIKSTNDFAKRVEQSSPSITSTMAALVRRGSLRFINQSSIPTLLKRLQQGYTSADDDILSSATHAKTILRIIAKHSPALFKSHVPELLKCIASEDNEPLVEAALQALASAAKQNPSLLPTDKRTTARLMKLALGENARHSKFATVILASLEQSAELCTQLVKTITGQLETSEEELLVARIAALAQLATLATSAFDLQGVAIIEHLLRKVVLIPIGSDPDVMDDEQEWFEDSQVPASLKARILALKVCRNRCMAHAGGDMEDDISAPVLKLMKAIILNQGSVTAADDDDPRVRSRMRLQAATSLLRLSTVKSYDTNLSPQFLPLALVVQDPCYEVRSGFLTKLINLLTPNKLPPRFNVIPFLTIHDPEAELKDRATAYVSYASRTLNPAKKLENLEGIFLRLLHLLAHHPDFGTSLVKIQDIAKYLEYYIQLVANPDNVSLIYHYATISKQLRDVESEIFTENFYTTGELAQELLKGWAHTHSWNLQSYPGKVKVPRDIVQPLSQTDGPQNIAKRVYLSEEILSWLAEKNKTKGPSLLKEKRATLPKQAATKRKIIAKPNRPPKRARPTKYTDDDSDDESDLNSATDGSGDVVPLPSEPSEDEEPPTGRDEKLARGARTRAKAKIRKQVKH